MSNTFQYGGITYKDIELVNKNTMKDSAIKSNAWLDCASSIQMVPVTMSDLKEACSFLPIVFSPHDLPMPIAILSFSTKHNPFVVDQQWRKHTYIPSSIRRYPFTLSNPKNAEQKRLLYIDTAAIDDKNMHRLFDENGEYTDTLKQAVAYCEDYDKQIHLTQIAINVINNLELFQETQLTITAADGSKKKTGIFKIIDIKKYDTLSDSDILTLQKARAFWIIHAHIISMTQIKNIARLSYHSE